MNKKGVITNSVLTGLTFLWVLFSFLPIIDDDYSILTLSIELLQAKSVNNKIFGILFLFVIIFMIVIMLLLVVSLLTQLGVIKSKKPAKICDIVKLVLLIFSLILSALFAMYGLMIELMTLALLFVLAFVLSIVLIVFNAKERRSFKAQTEEKVGQN